MGKIFDKICGLFKTSFLKVKTAVSTFWATFEKIGPLLIKTSGHNGGDQDLNLLLHDQSGGRDNPSKVNPVALPRKIPIYVNIRFNLHYLGMLPGLIVYLGRKATESGGREFKSQRCILVGKFAYLNAKEYLNDNLVNHTIKIIE